MSSYRICFIIVVVFLFSACGGGGGSNGDPGTGGSGGSGGSSGGSGGGTGGSGGSSGSGRTGTWSTGQILSNRSLGTLSKTSIDIAPDGSAIVTWVGGAQTGSTTPIMVSHLPATGSTWSAARQIDSGIGYAFINGNYYGNPDVGMDGAGNAIVVWLQNDGTQYSAFASQYQQATDSWTTSIALEADDASAADLISVAVNAAGNAMAIWVQKTPGQVAQLWSNTYSASTQSWSSSMMIDASVVVDASVNTVRPLVRADTTGNFRVFYVYQGTAEVQFRNRNFNMTSQSWQAAEIISSGETQVAYIEATQDSAGEWVALWTAMDGANYESLYSSRRDGALGTWSSAFIQEALPYNVESTTVLSAPNGKLTIAWSQPSQNRIGYYLDLYIRSYTPTDGWAATIRYDDLGGRIPLLISSGDDEARLFWSNLKMIQETTYTSSGWGAQTRPICAMVDATYCSNNLTTHDAAMNASGRAVYAWAMSVSSKNVVAVSVLQ